MLGFLIVRGPQRTERASPDFDNLRQASGNDMRQAEISNRSGELTSPNGGVKPPLRESEKKEFFF